MVKYRRRQESLKSGNWEAFCVRNGMAPEQSFVPKKIEKGNNTICVLSLSESWALSRFEVVKKCVTL